jgi:light-regulated signal transduction histidine kinase (bacteriophytochrome)
LNPAPETLADVLRENQELRSSLTRLQADYQAAEERTKRAGSATGGEQLSQFLYAASHDLQEPLRAILSYAQLLDRQLAADAPEHEYFSYIIGGANRMKELLQRLLLYARAGSSKRRAAINLNVPFDRALLKLAGEINFSSARIVCEPLPEALADEAEIAQVFENVIGNSLRFRSAAVPEIFIAAERGSDECTITVRDNGLGIDSRFCREALLPFKRLHHTDLPGSGLGLAICEKILRAHGGRIWLESDGSHGTTVRFTLPSSEP